MKLFGFFKKQEFQVILALIAMVAVLQLIGLIHLGIPHLRNPLGGDIKSFQACNGLDTLAHNELKPLFTDARVTQQTYQCRKFSGDPPVRETYIYYALTGPAHADQTKDQMLADLYTKVVAAGWIQDKDNPNFYLSPSSSKINIGIGVNDPAQGTFELNIHAPGTYIPADASTTKPANIPAASSNP